jgi:hypothetical protein
LVGSELIAARLHGYRILIPETRERRGFPARWVSKARTYCDVQCSPSATHLTPVAAWGRRFIDEPAVAPC